MQAILIDPHTQTVSSIEYDGNYENISKLLGCELFTVMTVTPKDDALFLDDEGWIIDQEDQQYFWWQGYPQLLAGRGLILGTNDEGESIAPSLTLDEAKSMVKWQSKVTALAHEPGPPTVWFEDENGNYQQVQ